MADANDNNSKLSIRDVYEEVGRNYRYFLTWRRALFGGYLVVLASQGVAFSWLYSNSAYGPLYKSGLGRVDHAKN